MPVPHVLLVEDEAAISEPFSLTLRREGFEPEVVRTVADARAAVARRPPDLVLLDLMLPDGDARDLCRELREGSEVPIIVLTARGTEADRIVGFALGADDSVVKPFSGHEVVARRGADGTLRAWSNRSVRGGNPNRPLGQIGEVFDRRPTLEHVRLGR